MTRASKARCAAVRLTQCVGKASMPTFELARAATRRANRNADKEYQPYRCSSCGQYHLGTAKGANYRRALQQRRLKAQQESE